MVYRSVAEGRKHSNKLPLSPPRMNQGIIPQPLFQLADQRSWGRTVAKGMGCVIINCHSHLPSHLQQPLCLHFTPSSLFIVHSVFPMARSGYFLRIDSINGWCGEPPAASLATTTPFSSEADEPPASRSIFCPNGACWSPDG